MRRLDAALLGALTLAACQVNLEGAPCTQVGKTTECPDGQACGNDGICSKRAAACGSALCIAGHSQCNSNTLKTCATTDDPVCGTWQAQTCAAPTSVCTTQDAAHAYCKCDANSATVFAADPVSGSIVGAAPIPTGLSSPPQCRFKYLGDALGAAVAQGGTTVKAYGSSGAPVTFAGETLPLVVPSGITISGADSPAGETILRGDAATSDNMVTLQGTLDRLHLQNVSMTGKAVEMTCGIGTPTLTDVVVSAGTTKLATGISVFGSCGAQLDRVQVSGAQGAAIDIGVPASSSVTANGSSFSGSGAGVQVRSGKVKLQADLITPSLRTQVTGNTGDGIVLDGTLPNADVIEATLSNVAVSVNGGTGVYVNSISTSSKLTMTSCDIYSNGTGTPHVYGPSPQRSAGGMLFTQMQLGVFTFQGNRIFANDGGTGADELAFYSSGNWTLNPNPCTSGTANALGCPGAGTAVSVTSGTVDAKNTIWSEIPPPLNGTVAWSPECSGIAPACPP